MTDPIRRALSRSPRLRAIADRPAAQQLIQTQRAARLLHPVGGFLAGQARPGTVGRYRLRSCDQTVHVRHRTRDVAILGEIFAADTYEPPADLELGGAVAVLDLGGNIGLFGTYALQRWDVRRLVSYEPDPDNFRLLAMTAAADPRWEAVQCAVSNEDGRMRFAAGRFSESRAAEGDEPGIDVPVVDLFAIAGDADLLKIDIEGGEWPILEDARLGGLEARAIVMEWHQGQCPKPQAPDYAARLLADAGFTRQHQPLRRFESNGILWAWRP